MKKTLSQAEAIEALDTWQEKDDRIIKHSRWSVIHEIVLQDPDGVCWQTTYSVGATESQDESPFKYDDEVTFTQVELREVTRLRYMPCDD